MQKPKVIFMQLTIQVEADEAAAGAVAVAAMHLLTDPVIVKYVANPGTLPKIVLTKTKYVVIVEK